MLCHPLHDLSLPHAAGSLWKSPFSLFLFKNSFKVSIQNNATLWCFYTYISLYLGHIRCTIILPPPRVSSHPSLVSLFPMNSPCAFMSYVSGPHIRTHMAWTLSFSTIALFFLLSSIASFSFCTHNYLSSLTLLDFIHKRRQMKSLLPRPPNLASVWGSLLF